MRQHGVLLPLPRRLAEHLPGGGVKPVKLESPFGQSTTVGRWECSPDGDYTFAGWTVDDFYARRGTSASTMVTTWVLKCKSNQDAQAVAKALAHPLKGPDSPILAGPPTGDTDTATYVIYRGGVVNPYALTGRGPYEATWRKVPHPVEYGFSYYYSGVQGPPNEYVTLTQFKSETLHQNALELHVDINGYLWERLAGRGTLEYIPSDKDLCAVGLVGTASFSIGELVFVVVVEQQEHLGDVRSRTVALSRGMVEISGTWLQDCCATLTSGDALGLLGQRRYEVEWTPDMKDWFKRGSPLSALQDPTTTKPIAVGYEFILIPTQISYAEFCKLLEETIETTLSSLGEAANQ